MQVTCFRRTGLLGNSALRSTAEMRRICRPAAMGNRSVVSLIASLLKLGSKSPAMSPTAESVRAQRADGPLARWGHLS